MTLAIADRAPEPQDSDLVSTIERARALLSAGDVRVALLLSAGAYEQARAGVTYARRVKASHKLVEKARRLQADALKIESLCLVAVADAVDEAQEAGGIAGRGRPPKGGEAPPTFKEVGLDAKHLHYARRLRGSIHRDPEFIDRTIEEVVAAGGEPTRTVLLRQSRAATRVKPSGLALLMGCDLSNLHWYELDAVIREYRRELAILERIKAHCLPPDDRVRIVEVISAAVLARLLEEGVDDE